MRNKIERLTHLLEDTHPHIVIISEHGLKGEALENTRLPGYSLKTHFSRQNHKKGGVAIYVEEGLEEDTKPLSVTHHCKELTCEVAMVKVTLGKEQLYVVGIYRTPNGKLDEALDILSTILEETKAENQQTIIMGDINVNSLKPDGDTRKLNDTLASHNMKRLPLPPTRITPNSISSIDCVCSNLATEGLTAMVIHAGVSDHTAQLSTLCLKTRKPDTTSSMCRNLSQKNLNTLQALLHNEDWERTHNAQTAEEAYSIFISTIATAMDAACPRKKTRPKRTMKPKIFDREAIKLKETYLESLRKYQETGNDKDKSTTAKTKKKYDLWLKKLKRQTVADHISRADNKSRAVWQVVNQERKNNKNGKTRMQLKVGGGRIKDPEQIAEHLNLFFSNIAEKTLSSNRQYIQGNTLQAPQAPDSDLLHLPCTDEEEIRKIIDSLKPKTSAGVDDISAKLLKHCSNALIPPLVSITNKSLTSGLMPSALKLAKVYPKYKGGCPMEASNYRPISLIPTFSKVIERVVLRRVMDHCERHNLLTNGQHGFLKGRSTTTAIINLAEFIIDHLELGKLVTGIMLDFSKAFDCLGHDQIIHKLEGLGIRGTACKWFESYLEGRRQVVEIRHTEKGITQDVRSKPLTINRGVPQGSVLGPVLFILFTNDMPGYLGEYCSTLMYADDTTLLLAGNSPDELAVDSYIALNMAYQYCHANNLVVNTNKTNQLAFGRRRDEVPCVTEVEMEPQAKFLGIIIDDKISWTQHVESLSKKLNISLYVIKRVRHISDLTTARTAYHALFESHLRYGIAIWGGTSAENLQRILRLQKRAIRALTGMSYTDSCREAFKDLKIMTVVALYIKEVILYVDGKALPRGSDLHNHNTRHAAWYTLPTHHSSRYERKPSYMGRKLYNLLPDEVVSQGGRKLKAVLNDWLSDRPFYSLDEFLHRKTSDN